MKEENKEVQGEMVKFGLKTIPAAKLALCRTDYSKYVGDLLDICFGRETLSESVLKCSKSRTSKTNVLDEGTINDIMAHVTTFITPFGRFRFQRLPFGISSAPEHFQRRMSQMLEGIPGTICHMDDILIWGSTQEEHDQRLTEVCKRLKNSGMTLNAKKCIFSQTSIKFLGHIIDGQGIHPDPDKIAAMENYQPPTNKKELKQLLGMANYLARFVPNYSDILFPLTSMLSNKVTFVWEAPQEAAFQKLKKILSSDPVLMIFDPGKETTVTTDASAYGLGATICQKQADGRRSVIAYASRTLTPTESRYAQIEKEALAVACGCEKFRDYLTGMHFKIETDHKPLIPIFSKKNLDDFSPRLQRIKLRMMKFSCTIVFQERNCSPQMHSQETLRKFLTK
ncbi:Retrovirus-related Pol polyprotein from transposon 17.6 [Araneus ventricosus]|uniref:Retrovirus-related Pol polyprotein from transposon 17.6 n=1 Tax=Araneus ventricosus TaxID=182803 RepID=A0A4Y2LKC0_ARAVE|nr:Retrovirus-related Pol polyprotein from transposon 17.6 [Araneus ventricosus]